MKKILVLMLVLGIASMASAGLTMSIDGSNNITIANDTAFPGPSPTGQFTAYLVTPLADGEGTTGSLTWGSAVSALDTGNAQMFAKAYPSTNGAYWYSAGTVNVMWVSVTDGSLGLLGAGDVMVLAYDAAVTSGTLYDAAGGAVLAVLVPEPMTIGLLGLGGLFLRRRK